MMMTSEQAGMVFTLKVLDTPLTDGGRLRTTAVTATIPSARLADVRGNEKTTAISATVVRGLIRLTDFATVTLLGLVIAHIYINETGVIGNARYIGAVALTGSAQLLTFELLGLYTLRAFHHSSKRCRPSCSAGS